MYIPRIALIALLLTTTLVFTAACGEKDEPADPNVGDTPKEVGTTPEQPTKPEVDTPSTEEPAKAPEKKLWTLNADSLTGYSAAFKDLKENAPRVLEGAASNALAMAKANDGLSFGNKATKILETHGLTEAQFKKFGDKLWPAVIAVAPEQASKASGLDALAGDHAKSLEGAAAEALKELTKNVTDADKAFVKENLTEILALLK